MNTKGNVYKVKNNNEGHPIDSIVVAIEDDTIPWCVAIKDYVEFENVDFYRDNYITLWAYFAEEDLIPCPELNP